MENNAVPMSIKAFKSYLTPGLKLTLTKAEMRKPTSVSLAGQIIVSPEGQPITIDKDGWYSREDHKALGIARTVINMAQQILYLKQRKVK